VSEEIKALQQRLRADLIAWMEERIPLLLGMLAEGCTMEMPIIDDFQLLICLSDASDANGSDYYPRVYSQTPVHHHLGLLEQARSYLNERDD